MMKKILICLVATLFISPVNAEIRKWKDENGKTHYGDAPIMAGSERVRADKDENVDQVNAERIRKETQNSIDEDAFNEAFDSAKNSGKCNIFKYYTFNDKNGEALAKAAKEECFRNMALTQVGKGSEAKNGAYTTWKTHYEKSTNQRQVLRQNIQNAEVQRQQQQQQDEQEQKQKRQQVQRQQQQEEQKQQQEEQKQQQEQQQRIESRNGGSTLTRGNRNAGTGIRESSVSSNGSREIEMRERNNYDPSNKFRGEIDRDGSVRMRNLNGDRLRGTIESDGYGKLRDENGNTYRVKPQ